MKIKRILFDFHSLTKYGPKSFQAIKNLISNGIQPITIFFREKEDIASELLERIEDKIPEMLKAESVKIKFDNYKDNTEGFLKKLKSEISDVTESLFVSRNLDYRRFATENKIPTVADPILVEDFLDNAKIRYVIIYFKGQDLYNLRELASKFLLPYYLSKGVGDDRILIGLVSTKGLAKLTEYPWIINTLSANPDLDELYLYTYNPKISENIREELFKKVNILGQPVPGCTDLLIALKKGQSIEEILTHSGHGQVLLLTPHPHIFENQPDLINRDSRFLSLSSSTVLEGTYEFFEDECNLGPNLLQIDIDRYSGFSDLDDQGKVSSRHISHTDNERAVSALISDLQALGLNPQRHAFNYNNKTYYNVIADLKGTGNWTWRVSKTVHEFTKWMERYREWPWEKSPDPLIIPPWKLERPLKQDIVSEWENKFFQLVDLKRWEGVTVKEMRMLPWWPVTKENQNLFDFRDAGVIVVGCHLDSTASFENGYTSSTDNAPGADDNASGIAATLAIARYFTSLPTRLYDTIRFAFFNAEEVGLVGSQAYVAERRAINEYIRGAYIIDMIGYNSDEENVFEAHVGTFDDIIRDKSLPLAEKLSEALVYIWSLGPLQVYKGTRLPFLELGDPDETDGAIGRSDHSSFHMEQYPAVLVIEDLFSDAVNSDNDANPNYHEYKDTRDFINVNYMTNIACAIIQAILNL